jgi:hypothetical protein
MGKNHYTCPDEGPSQGLQCLDFIGLALSKRATIRKLVKGVLQESLGL